MSFYSLRCLLVKLSHYCRGSRDVPCLRIMRLRNVIDLAVIDGERNAPDDRVRNGREVES